ncbi:MAG TPA: PHP domain-containing protein [Gammaproteobacteria bacterium]|nr:PHP domain-containing protein [Gammaproteobacteria bacterium]
MTARYDLHSHSLASDGTLTPAALVQAAHAAGIGVLALTDHDTTDGIREAADAAQALGLRLVQGAELSVTWQAQTVHILGLGLDTENAVLQAGLAQLRESRDSRAEEIGRRLARAGIGGAWTGARALAQGRIVGRMHFAHYLVAQGHAASVRDVFRHFLVNNKPGYVSVQWASLEDALAWIRAAGGIAVIAHPARYRMTASKLRHLVGEFRELGGSGLEVVSGSHTRDNVDTMAALCRNERLLASCGSDYHGPENCWIRLGELPDLPAGCKPVWQSERWRLQ